MVRLVRDKINKIAVRVTSTVDYTGFSASLSLGGATKDIPNLKASNIRLTFSPEEISEIGQGMDGTLTVLNANGDVYVKNRVRFISVSTEGEAAGYQKISIVLVSMSGYAPGTGGGSMEQKIEEAVQRAMVEAIDDRVEEAVDSIIDEKVETAVSDIIDEKVEDVVDQVIDEKVEEAVTDLFDDSDSDTIGGEFNNLKNFVYKDLEPRLTNVETTLEEKISMDYEDSADNIIFFSGVNESDDSESV